MSKSDCELITELKAVLISQQYSPVVAFTSRFQTPERHMPVRFGRYGGCNFPLTISLTARFAPSIAHPNPGLCVFVAV
ncbi:hypothetical protein [Mesorhizobium sp. M0435]|uniref:hypothetical protein n=1 Tax=Mesorhizobium sp. M0435 TaxID=2956944 RepID=UPI00333B8954